MNKLFKSITSLTVALGMGITGVSAYEFAAIKQESDQNVITLEAEDFLRGGGFEIVEDSEASGGKCVVGTGDDSRGIEFDLNFETGISRLVIYATHKAEDKKSNLSYISIDHFESYSLYDYEIGKWNDTRLFYGEAEKGDYTVKLTSIRKGQKIDKLTIKYAANVSDSGEQVFKSNALDKSKTYIPGKEEYGALNIKETEERVYGSYFFEVEDGNNSELTRVGEDENASGGKYWYAPAGEGLKHLTEANMSDDIFSRFKFKVTHKGNYIMWIRYSTPASNQKSTWFGIDDSDYYRLDDSQVRGWRWQKSGTTRYLDEGWHTLDIKYRQPGHMIDCVILTDVSGFSAKGKGSLPGEPILFDEGAWDVINLVNETDKIKTNNFRSRLDCDFVHLKKDILVPATNLFATMSITLEEYDDYYIAMQDRNHLKFYMDSDRIVANGKAKHTGTKMYREQGAIPMVSLNAVKEAFGIDYEYNEKESTLNVFYDYDENYRDAKDGEIIVTPGERSFSYEIPCDDPNAKVRVWYKYNLTDTLILSRMNWDNMNSLINGRIDRSTAGSSASNPDWWYWREAIPPTYIDGVFRGSEQAQHVEPYDIKVKIVRDGVEDVFVKRDAFRPTDAVYATAKTAAEYAPDTQGELLLVPTFENISYYIDVPSKETGCTMYYRKNGEEEWKKAYTPTFDPESNQYRGSIVYCSEDTEYEVKAVLTGAGAGEKNARIKTWTSNPTIAKTIGLSEIYNGNGPLQLTGIKGTPDGWIKVVADDKCDTINGTKNFNEAVMIYDCAYLIFEGITVRGGDRHCINISGKSDNVRVINCDIAEWGREGIMHDEYGGYSYRGLYTNNLGGVFFYDVTNTVIERCYIHDSDVKTNPWNTDTYKNVHPKGGTAIQMLGKGGMVIRYNDAIGSDEHRYNDVMEGTNNSGRDNGSIGCDADVYGNMMIYSEDDSIELDGGQMNLRVYNNRFEQGRCGISAAPNRMGPCYIFNNVITNMGGTYKEEAGTAIKAGGSPDGVFGMQYYFNNTIDSRATGPANITYGNSSEFHSVSRNNIFVTRTDGWRAFSNKFADERDDNDYDLIAGGTILVKEGDEANAVLQMPEYKDYDGGNLHLAEGSAAIGKGTYVDNFMEMKNPDMGAFQTTSGDKRHMPFRPVDMYADNTIERTKDLEEREITIHVGDIGEGHTYSLMKNRDFGWLEIISEEGTEDVPLNPNTDVTFKIKGDLSKCKFEKGNGMVLFRLENGFSVPITVICTK